MTQITPAVIAELRGLKATGTVNHLDALLDAAEGMRWVPVSEGMPKKNGSYIAALSMDNDKWIDLRYFFGDRWDTISAVVTHWMPLPQPPKESE